MNEAAGMSADTRTAETRTLAPPFPLELSERHGDHQYDQIRRIRGDHRHVLQYGNRAVIDFADVDALISDRRFISGSAGWLDGRGIDSSTVLDWWMNLMFTKDGPPHRRLRTLVSGAFTPQVVEGWRTATATIAEALCDEIGRSDELDISLAFCSRLPLRTMCVMLGVPERDMGTLEGWAEELGNLFIFAITFTPQTQERMNATLDGFAEYAERLLADRRANPREADLISRLIAARDEGDRLTHEELVVMLGNLLVSANDSTRSAVTNTVYTLLRHRDQWRLLCENPDLAARAVDEAMRYESPLELNPRMALEDLTFAGMDVAKGEVLFANLLGAGRDPQRYPDPDHFDITRTDVKVQCLGGGPHYCLGGPLAKIMMQEGLKVLVRRFPDMTVVEDGVRWSPITHSRHLVALPVRPYG
jgi:cytochrome P450